MVDLFDSYPQSTCEICFENTIDPTRTGVFIVQHGTEAQENGITYTNIHEFTLPVATEYLKRQCNYDPDINCLWFLTDEFDGIRYRIYVWCDQQWDFSLKTHGTRKKYFIGERHQEESSCERGPADSASQEHRTATSQSFTSHQPSVDPDGLAAGRGRGSPGWNSYVPTSTQSPSEEGEFELGNETIKLVLQSKKLLRSISPGRTTSWDSDLDGSDPAHLDHPAKQDLSTIREQRVGYMTCAVSVDTVSESAHSTAGIMAGSDGAVQKEIKRLGARVQQIERAMREVRDKIGN